MARLETASFDADEASIWQGSAQGAPELERFAGPETMRGHRGAADGSPGELAQGQAHDRARCGAAPDHVHQHDRARCIEQIQQSRPWPAGGHDVLAFERIRRAQGGAVIRGVTVA